MKRGTLMLLTVMVFLTVVSNISVVVADRSGAYLYVFGSDECHACRYFKEWLSRSYNGTYYFCELSNHDCQVRFSRLIELMGLPTVGIPTTVVVNGTVRAIVIGAVTSKEFWKYVMNLPTNDGIPVFTGGEVVTSIENPSAREIIMKEVLLIPPSSSETTQRSQSSQPRIDYYYLTVSLAALDSINPCVFVLFITLLVTVFLVGGRMKAVMAGIAFTSAVFLSYFLLGIVLHRFTAYIPRTLMPVIATIFGILTITNVLGKYLGDRIVNKVVNAKCVACAVYEKLRDRVNSLTDPVLWSGLLGFASSFTLLPCSAGPYILFARVVAELPIAEALKYILLYNIIFILPLLVITLLGYSILKIEKVVLGIEKYEKILRVVGGSALILLGVTLFLQ